MYGAQETCCSCGLANEVRRLRAQAAALRREHTSLSAQHNSLVLEKARQVPSTVLTVLHCKAQPTSVHVVMLWASHVLPWAKFHYVMTWETLGVGNAYHEPQQTYSAVARYLLTEVHCRSPQLNLSHENAVAKARFGMCEAGNTTEPYFLVIRHVLY